jgi:CubicO group peptidase (beta-lactamase class C family)
MYACTPGEGEMRASAVFALSVLVAGTAMGQGLPSGRPSDVGLSASALERIAPALQSYVDSGKLPGLLAVVARHGKVVYVATVGSPAAGMPAPHADAVFRIFSMTKPITSVAAMQLIERGRLAPGTLGVRIRRGRAA